MCSAGNPSASPTAVPSNTPSKRSCKSGVGGDQAISTSLFRHHLFAQVGKLVEQAIVARHCVTCVGCTPYSLANCETVLSPTRASNPTLALKAALCRLRFAFIVCFLFASRPTKVHLNLWSSFWGPPQFSECCRRN